MAMCSECKGTAYIESECGCSCIYIDGTDEEIEEYEEEVLNI